MITYGGERLPMARLAPGGRFAARVVGGGPKEVKTKYGTSVVLDVEVIGGKKAMLFLPRSVQAAAMVLATGSVFELSRGPGQKSAHIIRIAEGDEDVKALEKTRPAGVKYIERKSNGQA